MWFHWTRHLGQHPWDKFSTHNFWKVSSPCKQKVLEFWFICFITLLPEITNQAYLHYSADSIQT